MCARASKRKQGSSPRRGLVGFDFKEEDGILGAVFDALAKKFPFERESHDVTFPGGEAGATELEVDLDFEVAFHSVVGPIQLGAKDTLKFDIFEITGIHGEDLAEVLGAIFGEGGSAGELAEFVEVLVPVGLFGGGGSAGVDDGHERDELVLSTAQRGFGLAEAGGFVVDEVGIAGDADGDSGGVVVDQTAVGIPRHFAEDDSGFVEAFVEGEGSASFASRDGGKAFGDFVFVVAGSLEKAAKFAEEAGGLLVFGFVDEEIVVALDDTAAHEEDSEDIEIAAKGFLVEVGEDPSGGCGGAGEGGVGISGGLAHIDEESDGFGNTKILNTLFDGGVIGIFLDPAFAVLCDVEGGGRGGDEFSGFCVEDLGAWGEGFFGGLGVFGRTGDVEVVDGKGTEGALESSGGDGFEVVSDKEDPHGMGTLSAFGEAAIGFAAGGTFDVLEASFFTKKIDVGLASEGEGEVKKKKRGEEPRPRRAKGKKGNKSIHS